MSTIQAILLDLDDTLLGNNTAEFMQRYFALLGEYARPMMDNDTFLPHLIQATQAAIRNTDPAHTNAEIFWANFEALTGGRRGPRSLFLQRSLADPVRLRGTNPSDKRMTSCRRDATQVSVPRLKNIASERIFYFSEHYI